MRKPPAVQKAKALFEKRLKEVLEILQDPEKTVVHLREITLAPGMKWSLLNQLLVRIQGGTDARGAKQWAEVGRSILPGAKPIWIRVPIIHKVEVEDEFGNNEEKEVVVGFRWGKVYDITDTEGDPINPTTIQFPTAQKIIQALGLRVDVVPGYTRTAGLFVPMRNLIIVRDETDRMTLAHELGHAIHYQTLKARGIRFRDLPKVVTEGTAEILGALIYYQDTGEVLQESYTYLMNLGVDPKTSRAQMLHILKEVDLCIKHIVYIVSSLSSLGEDSPADDEPQVEEDDASPETKASESAGTAEDSSGEGDDGEGDDATDEGETGSSTEPPSSQTESSPEDHPPIFAEVADENEIILHIDPDFLRVFDTTSSALPIIVEFRDQVASFRNVLLLSQQYPQDETSVAIPIPVRADEEVLKYLEGRFALKFPAPVFGRIIRKKLTDLVLNADGTLRATDLVAHGEDISENPYAMPPVITPELPFVSVSMDYQTLRKAIRSAETVAPRAFPSPGSPRAVGVPGAILSFLLESGEVAVTGTDGTVLYTTRIPARYNPESLRNSMPESVAIPRKLVQRHLSPRMSAREIQLVIPFPPEPPITLLTISHPSGIAAYLRFNRIRIVGMPSEVVSHATSPHSPWKKEIPLFTGSASIGDLNTLFHTTSANSPSHPQDLTILARFSGSSATFTRDPNSANGHMISINPDNPDDSGSDPFTLKIDAEVASRALQALKHFPANSQVHMAIYPYRTELQLPYGDRLFLASRVQKEN